MDESLSEVDERRRVLTFVCQDYGPSQTVFEDCNVMARLGNLFLDPTGLLDMESTCFLSERGRRKKKGADVRLSRLRTVSDSL
jgi:hypothetical protein